VLYSSDSQPANVILDPSSLVVYTTITGFCVHCAVATRGGVCIIL